MKASWTLSLLFLLACRGSLEPGAPFFHGLRSGQAPEEVQGLLGLGPEQWHPVDDALLPRGRTLGFRMVRVEIKTFAHQDCPGRLVLYFFNDRLVRARFHPADFPRFQKVLAEKEDLSLAAGTTLDPEDGLRIRVLRDQAGGSYVVWEDPNLLAQWDALNKRR
ncbi:MAG: hypothetical protein HY823_07950 [Acidobacteria bacterium]|nr:hypothetical protein [Acidobacteriota bacterium]